MEWGGFMIYYLIPEYIDKIGDCCRLRDENGENICNKNMKSMTGELFRDKCLDLKIIKRRCSRVLSQKNLTPLYLGPEEILMPIRIRKPRVQRDGGYGYVNYFMLEKIVEDSLILKDGSRIFFIDSERSIIKRMKMAKILDEAFRDNKDRTREFRVNLKEPATKEDISVLLGEIVELKRKLLDRL